MCEKKKCFLSDVRKKCYNAGNFQPIFKLHIYQNVLFLNYLNLHKISQIMPLLTYVRYFKWFSNFSKLFQGRLESKRIRTKYVHKRIYLHKSRHKRNPS